MASVTTDHKEGEATVKVYYKTGKTLADGSHPFQIRVTKDRKQIYRSTGFSLNPKYWNADKSHYSDAIRKSYPKTQRDALIAALDQWLDKYSGVAKDLAMRDEQHDASTVLAKAIEGRKATRRVMLLAYCDELTAGLKKAGRNGNAIVYGDLRNQLAKFIRAEYGADDVPFERITVSFCHEWETTLLATGVKETTISNRFRTLRAVLNKAIATGSMKPEHYPLARSVAEKHKFSVGKFDVSTAKRAVSRADVRRLEALELTTERHQLAKNVFLFSFYVGGINFVDLAQLRWRNISVEYTDAGQYERLDYVRQKTGGKFTPKLLAPAAAIVAAYRPLTNALPASYVFPILDEARHVSPIQVNNRLHKMLGQVNKDLKELGSQAGIATPLTTYVARHSMATTLRRTGATTAVISQAMGHKSESVTNVYLESFASEQIDAAFEGLL